jgi:N-acetylglucosaminyldiphosphoundecaprenol N-acetyl-beta-D-mannosaminyltransferase
MASLESIPFVEILGVRIRRVNFPQCLEYCEETVRERGRLQIATCNLDFMRFARSDEQLRCVLNRTLNVADGVPLLWAARLLGSPLAGRVNGTDLVWALCGLAARHGWRVFLLGAESALNGEAQARLRERNPGLVTAGDSPMVDLSREEDNLALARKIRDFDATIIFGALGCPKQEFWLDRYLAETGACLGMGVGGALDIIAGKYRRAPRWMQRCGLEWAFRLSQQPRYLWRRYLADAAFFGSLARQLAGRRFGRGSPRSNKELDGGS